MAQNQPPPPPARRIALPGFVPRLPGAAPPSGGPNAPPPAPGAASPTGAARPTGMPVGGPVARPPPAPLVKQGSVGTAIGSPPVASAVPAAPAPKPAPPGVAKVGANLAVPGKFDPRRPSADSRKVDPRGSVMPGKVQPGGGLLPPHLLAAAQAQAKAGDVKTPASSGGSGGTAARAASGRATASALGSGGSSSAQSVGMGNAVLASALKNLKSAAAGKEEVDRAVQAIGKLANNSRAAKKMSQNRDTIRTLLDSMRTRPKFGKMVEYSLECLKNLAVDENSIEELIDEGVLDVILMVRKLNPYNERIAHLSNLALQAFAINERLAALIAEKMGADAHLFSLRKHVEPQTLVSTGNVMHKLMRHQNNVHMYVKAGAIADIAAVCKNNVERPEVVASMAQALVRVAAAKPEYAAEIVKSGAVESILKCLAAHPEMAALCEHTTALVGQMARWGPQLVEALRKLGAVDVLVAAVEMHPNNRVIEALAAQCFKLLSGKEDIGVALVKVAKSTANTFDLATALAKISSLLLVDENVDYLVKNHGIGALLAALQHAVGDTSEIASKILESGCRAVMRCAKDENQIYDILQKGGVQLMLNILAAHGKEEKVAAAALACLAKLCSRKENAIYLAQSGAIQAAIAALKAHPNSLDAARAVLALISSMSRYPECVQALVNAGAFEAVLQINKTFGADADLAKECLEVLGRLGITKDNMLKLAALGGLQDMCRTLLQHVTNADVAKAAILLIESAAHVPQNLDALRKLNAVATILQAMAANRGDAVLQAVGNRCLERLAGKGQVKEAVDHLGVLIRECMSADVSLLGADNLFNAVKLLSNLTFQDGAMAQLTQAGALEGLVSALGAAMKLAAGEQRSAIFTMAAKAIAQFCKDPGAASKFVLSGGIANLLKAVLADLENEDLAESAMEIAMRCAADPKNVDRLIKDGAVEDIVAIMKAFPFNEKIQLNALKALAGLCANPEGAARFLAAGGADVLIEALRNNLDDPVATKLALDLIAALATDDEAVAKLLAAGAIDAILAAMRKYAADPAILTSCMKALCALMINEKVALEVGDKGGVPLMIGAMRTHYTHEALVEIDIVVCDSLVSVPLNVGKFLAKELATVDLVRWTMGAYAANRNIKDGAARILAVLEQQLAKEKAKEEKQQQTATLEAFDDAACDLLIRQLASETDPDKIKLLCQQVLLLAQDPKNADLLLARGGLKALARVLKQFQNNENVFYPASDAFMALCDASGEQVGVLLEDAVLLEALSEMMAVRPTFTKQLDPVLLQRVLTASAKMKLKRPETVQQLLNQHVLESLLKLISVQDNPVVLSQAAKLLAKMSNNEKVAAMLARMANIRELIAAMRKHFKNEEFLRYGVFLLGNLAQNDDLKAQIGIEGGIQLIIQILEAYCPNEGLIENCAYALANLSFNNDVNMSFIVACKGIQQILLALKQHPKRVELLEPAICTLCNLCHKNDPNKDTICKVGGAQAIVDAILNNFNSIDLVLTGFRTLGNLAYSAPTISTIIKAGGVQGIVAGMTVHSEELDVIDIAIRVLTNLASDLDDENMTIMAQEGAVQAIVEVAHKYAANLDLEIAALGCLCNLAREHYNATMIIRQNGTDALVAAMNGLQFDPELVEKAMKLLAVLSVSEGNQDKVIEAKSVTAAVAAMKQHVKNKVILGSGLKAIANLSYSDAVATKLAAEGPVTFVLGLLNDSLQDPPLMAECFVPLGALCRSEANAWSMAETVMKTLVTALNQHAQDMKFHGAGYGFLAALCVHARAAEYVVPTNMIATALTSLKTFKLDPPLLIKCLRALENVAFSTQPVRDHMKAQRVIEACVDIKDRHSVRDDVVRQCQAVVDAINRTKTDLSASPFLSLVPGGKRSAKELFGELKQITAVAELDKTHKNLLLAGALLQKHSLKAAPRVRHIYVTPDLKWLIWKDPKEPVDPKQRMKTFKMRSVERGRCTPQLQRKKTFGGFYAKEECALAIMGRERTVDLECADEAEREKWVLALQALIGYLKTLKAQAQKFTSR